MVAANGFEVVHVPAGPAAVLPKDDLLPFMGAFAEHWRPTGASGGCPTSRTRTSG
ncbi:hypothetical protein GCM10020358_33760 [Amorphoplanes nipponensis]